MKQYVSWLWHAMSIDMVICWGGKIVMSWQGHCSLSLMLKVKGRKGGCRGHGRSRWRMNVWRLVWVMEKEYVKVGLSHGERMCECWFESWGKNVWRLVWVMENECVKVGLYRRERMCEGRFESWRMNVWRLVCIVEKECVKVGLIHGDAICQLNCIIGINPID